MHYKLAQLVKFTKPGLQGPVRIAGTIVGTNARGEYIIRSQGDGYFTLSQFQLDQHNSQRAGSVTKKETRPCITKAF